MNTKPKLPLWVGAALWFFGTVGSVSLLLATLSMFGLCFYPLSRENRNLHRDVILINSGTLYIQKNAFWDSPLRRLFYVHGNVSPLPQQITYTPKYIPLREGWILHIPLFSIGALSLLAFATMALKASRMRRKATLAALGATW